MGTLSHVIKEKLKKRMRLSWFGFGWVNTEVKENAASIPLCYLYVKSLLALTMFVVILVPWEVSRKIMIALVWESGRKTITALQFWDALNLTICRLTKKKNQDQVFIWCVYVWNVWRLLAMVIIVLRNSSWGKSVKD